MSVAVLLQVHGAQSTAEFPFEFREGLLWINVESDRSGERLNFLVDTGAGVSALNLNVAKRMGLRLGRKVEVQGVDTKLTGYWQEHLFLKTGGIKLPSECLAIDLSKLSRSCERPVDGLLGADFFRGRITEIDFESSKIRVRSGVDSADADVRVPLEVRPCGMRLPVSVNGGGKQFVRLDTGCASAFQWVTTEVPDTCARKVAIGLAELAIPQTTTTVRLGNCEFENVATGLHKNAIFSGESGLLGNGLLTRFSVVVIDCRNDQLLLRKRTSAQ